MANINYTGNIHLIVGPMFSGKTTELLRLLNRTKVLDIPILLIKYNGDTRFDDKMIVTHDNISHMSTIISDGHSLGNTLKEFLTKNPSTKTYIFIDEIQFFNDGAEVCDKLANLGYFIVACGLQGDYQRNIFPTIAKLIPLCEKITHLSAVDKESGSDCSFTKRITNDNQLEVIGGDDKYQATSRKNYFKN